jgi:branched-chain amino acid transport system substrate-binding protein
MAGKYELKRRRFMQATAAGSALLAAPFIGLRQAHGQAAIKIGAQGVSSGSHADYGRQIQMGARFAADEINAKGGIMGRPVEILYRDDELNNDVALKNARFFKEQGVNFMIGTDSSGVALALGPVLPELDLIQIFTHAATEKLNEDLVFKKGIKHIFRGSVPVYQDAILPALVFKDNKDIKRIANLGADYEYGRTSWAMFHSTLRKHRPDVEIVGEAWAPFFTADFTPHISALLAKKPDLIFATPWAGEAVLMLRQATTLGVFDSIQVWWQAMGGSVDVMEGISRDVVQGKFKNKLWATARYIWNWPDTPENKAFVNRFTDRWGRLPNYSAECTYSAVFALKAAVEKAGSVKTADVIKALEGLELSTPAGKRFYRPEDHQAVYNVPAGRVTYNKEVAPIAHLTDLKVFPAEDYYRKPPFS